MQQTLRSKGILQTSWGHPWLDVEKAGRILEDPSRLNRVGSLPQLCHVNFRRGGIPFAFPVPIGRPVINQHRYRLRP